MFDCTAMEERVSEYIEGTLSLDERLTVEAHLRICAPCTELHESIDRVLQWARSFPSHPSPQHMVSEILAGTPDPEKPNLTCPAVRDLLSEYLDGLLSADRGAAIEEHLAACRACDELHETMACAIHWTGTASSSSPPERLVERILAHTRPHRIDARIRCAAAQEQLSALIDGVLSPDRELAVNSHLADCGSCREIHENMVAAVRWGREFPFYEAPAWSAARILANTSRESWLPQRLQEAQETLLDTFVGVGRWILEPRRAMTVFASVLILGWMTRIAGGPLAPAAFFGSGDVYASVEELADDVYDRSVRLYFGLPYVVFGEIQYRIEQLRESS